jgi:hypothetical protein
MYKKVTKMDHLISDLNQLDKIDSLIALKEQIKNQVVSFDLTWQSRMDLYKRIQLINQRIAEIQKSLG